MCKQEMIESAREDKKFQTYIPEIRTELAPYRRVPYHMSSMICLLEGMIQNSTLVLCSAALPQYYSQ